METLFNSAALGILLIPIIAIIIFALVLLFYVYEMATNKGRSTFYWIIFSLIFTPIISIILLACIGETEDKRKLRLLEEAQFLIKSESKSVESNKT
jgi:heme/copper-type cytochrome/quinol oxidase subunit 4